MHRIIATLLVLVTLGARAQDDVPVNVAGWYGYEGFHLFEHGKPWGIMLEGYGKYVHSNSTMQGVFFRAGFFYELPKGHRLNGGVAYQWNYPYDEAAEPYGWPDYRLWQQYIHRHPAKSDPRKLLQHRLRLEERWLARKSDPDMAGFDQFNFEITFRYQLKYDHPLAAKWSATVYDEIHLRLTQIADEKFLDQNRVYLGVKYFIDADRWWRIEAGYMLQTTWNALEDVPGRKRVNHTPRITITSDAPFRRKPRAEKP